MGNLIDKFVSMFKKPDATDQERIDKWHKEVDEADRRKEERRKALDKGKNTLPLDAPERSVAKAKGLIKKIEKNKNRTLSTNF